MTFFDWFLDVGNTYVVHLGIPVGDQNVPVMVLLLLGAGAFLTARLGFLQLRRLGHAVRVTTGAYDHAGDPGDVSHFRALTTALSATVGIGNIAGVAIAIHWGGPGVLFWMWMTAALGMATKYTEVTLAQKYRVVAASSAHRWEGTVSGGPMYYIERGLGPGWKWMAVLFALLLGTTAFLTGNAIQANTVADTMATTFSVPAWMTGLVTSATVAAVILGGITRIAMVTSILVPFMAALYVLGALTVLALHADRILPAFGLILREAFHPTAGVAGTGAGAFLVTLMWGVRRGLLSNEAGVGSAPIAHAAARTDEPVSEGVVALLEPFIDTILICTMTGLVILVTGASQARYATEITLGGGDVGYAATVADDADGQAGSRRDLRIVDGRSVADEGDVEGATGLTWHGVAVDRLFVDEAMTTPFTGSIRPWETVAEGADGQRYASLYAMAAESGAPLTQKGFRRGLAPIGDGGQYIVVVAVLLFAVSTAIAWSYYGDRCANYLFGPAAVMPYRLVFVLMHFVGAVLPLTTIWNLGDIFLAIVVVPNLLALVLLAPEVVEETRSYFTRKPWLEPADRTDLRSDV